MNRDWHSFTAFAKVKIETFVMHALVSDAVNTFVTIIANRHVHGTYRPIGTQVISGVGNLDECMMGVLFLGNSVTGAACVEIRTISAFITATSNAGVTEITSRTVNRANGWRGTLGHGHRGRCRWSGASDARNDDAAWFNDFPELVEGIMSFGSTCSDAFSAEVVIRAIQALVSDSFNLL